jgi:acetylornithine deacetylase
LSPALMTAEILRELVAIPTPSAVSNLPLLHWVQRFLEPRGWRVELLPYVDPVGVAKSNLLAWPGNAELGAHVDLAFVCHTDTVPYAADWAGALILQERDDGSLHGCGSCDVKGALACFLAAVAEACTADVDQLSSLAPTSQSRNVRHPVDVGSIALILTADEEIGCKGMERLLASMQLRIGSAIVSEPTSLRAGIAGKGYGLTRITVEGREAHSAFPQQGVSAISIAARLIARIEDCFAAEARSAIADSLFDPPQTTLNIGVIEGGTAKNIIPGHCSFLVEWRSIPGEDPNSTLDRLRALVQEAQIAEPRAAIQLEALRAEPGFAPADLGPLQLRLKDLLGTEPTGISFGSEASRLARIADEMIVIGPGDMRTAHSDRECVPVVELERWTNVLADLIRYGFGSQVSESRPGALTSLEVSVQSRAR